MKTSLIIASILAFTLVHADPLIQVKPDTSNEDPSRVADVEAALKQEFPEARISVRRIEILDHENTRAAFPQGNFNRVTAVVAHPETKHAALLEFAIYRQGDDSITLPLAGDRSEFASLLRSTNKKLRGVNDAIAVGKAFATIYRLKLASAPEIIQLEGIYSISLPLADGNEKTGRIRKMKLNVEIDEEGSAQKTTMDGGSDDPSSQKPKQQNRCP